MPAFHLAEQAATLSQFDVVGTHSETHPSFVQHVALLNSEECEVSCDDTVRVVHMGWPLETERQLSAEVAGRIPLTNAQIKSIKTWIAKVKDEYKFESARKLQQYVIDPPWKDVRDENTGVRRYRRYSCAGFVLDAHLRVDVSLLIIDKEALPEVTRQTLEAAYPDVFQNPDRLNRFGIQDNGPWRVVLAGYVLHALDRSSDEIQAEPYLAQRGDELF